MRGSETTSPGRYRASAMGDAAFAMTLTVAMRVLNSAVGGALAPLITVDVSRVRSNQLTEHLVSPASGLGHALLGIWERFDTLWYLHIAASGYDRPQAIVFYPLYPLLIRWTSILIQQPLATALLLSTIATFFLLWGLVKLARLDASREEARRAALLCAVWPASFILISGYPESLVASFTVWAVFAARRRRWAWAGAAGFLAGLAKAVGVISVVPLMILALQERSSRALWAGLPLLAPVLVLGAASAFGLGSLADAYSTYWKTEFALPWTTFALAVRQVLTGNFLVMLNLGMLVAVTLVAVSIPTRPENRAYALTAVCFFLLKKTDPVLQSTMRYALCVYPIYGSVAAALDTRKHTAVLAVALYLLNVALLWHFLQWSLVV